MPALPESLIDELKKLDAFDEAAFRAAHEQSAITSVRLHPRKQSNVFQTQQHVPWCVEGRYLEERPVFTLDPLFHAGAYYVQEASSMFLDYLVRQICPDRDGLRVLDLCAAPGGKSTLLASMLGENALLISNEVIRTRVPVLEENVVRWGFTNNWVTSNDPKDFGKLQGYFDLIVVDAPCSGSGLFRKDPMALKEWSPANVALCSQRQQRILSDVWPALKEDGILIYATCSYSPQEDEAILDWLAVHFEVSGIETVVPEEWGIVRTQSDKGLTGYRFFPDKADGEGFFIAALRKKEAKPTITSSKFKSQHDKRIAEQSAYLLGEGSFIVSALREEFVALNSRHETDFQLLQKHLYLRKAGVLLGSPAGRDWLPAHEVALSLDRAADLPVVHVTKEQALRFLKKEDMGLNLREKGWMIIACEGLGLGWIKSLGNRINNYLPKHWRIRMDISGD